MARRLKSGLNKKIKYTNNPRVRMYENGMCTVSGLHYDDLRSLITSASLHQYQSENEYEAKHGELPKYDQENNDEAHWYVRQRFVSDRLHDAVMAEIDRVNHRNDKPPTLKERLLESKKERDTLKAIHDAIERDIEERRKEISNG